MAKGKSKPRTPRKKIVEFNGVNHKLAIVGKGRSTTPEQKIEIAKVICMMYATDQFTMEDCLKYCGVGSKSTWWNWVDSIEQIERLYLDSQLQKDREYKHRLKHRARTMAERLIDGYTIEVQEKTSEPVITKAGETPSGMEIVTVRTKTVFVKPSVPIILNTLYNTDGKTFTRNPEPYKAGNEELPTDIKVTIQSGSVSPVTSEEDINQDI